MTDQTQKRRARTDQLYAILRDNCTLADLDNVGQSLLSLVDHLRAHKNTEIAEIMILAGSCVSIVRARLKEQGASQ